MRNNERASATQALFGKSAPMAASRGLAAWIGATDYGTSSAVVTPRIRDNLVLRLVAGRRQERDRGLIHATGAT